MSEPLRATASQPDDEAAISTLVGTWLWASKAGELRVLGERPYIRN